MSSTNEVNPRCAHCKKLCPFCKVNTPVTKKRKRQDENPQSSEDEDDDKPLSELKEEIQPLSTWKTALQKADERPKNAGVETTWQEGDEGIPDHVLDERVNDDGQAEILLMWDDGKVDNASWEKKAYFQQWKDYDKLLAVWELEKTKKRVSRQRLFKGGKY